MEEERKTSLDRLRPNGLAGFMHAGLKHKQSDFDISASLKERAMSIRQIYLSKERRKGETAKVTETERGALRAGNGRSGWSRRLDLTLVLVCSSLFLSGSQTCTK